MEQLLDNHPLARHLRPLHRPQYPRNRPLLGKRGNRDFQRLKQRNVHPLWQPPAFEGVNLLPVTRRLGEAGFPGRCPGLVNDAPSGLNTASILLRPGSFPAQMVSE